MAGLASLGLVLTAAGGTASAAAATAQGRTTQPAPAAGSWHAMRTPLPPGAASDPKVRLNSVTCHGPSLCAAVGFYSDSAGSIQGLLLTRTGSAWTAARAPHPASAFSDPGVQLSAVSCPSLSVCVAAGGYSTTPGFTGFHGLLLSGRGKSWHQVRAPLPADADQVTPAVQITSLACPSVSTCVAAGTYQTASQNGHLSGLILTGSGTSWKATEAPLPPDASTGQDVFLKGLACASATTCEIGGNYIDQGGNEQGMLLTGSGTSWSPVSAPAPPGAASDRHTTLPDVLACPATTTCVAAGSYRVPGPTVFQTEGSALTGLGSSWAPARLPMPRDATFPKGPQPVFRGMACATSKACTAVGVYQGRGFNVGGVLVSGFGPAWRVAKPTLPAGGLASLTFLNAIACPAVSACAVAGTYTTTSFGQEGLLLTGSGTKWRPTQAPVPSAAATGSDANVNLWSVACTAGSSCLAVGSYVTNTQQQEGLLLTGPA